MRGDRNRWKINLPAADAVVSYRLFWLKAAGGVKCRKFRGVARRRRYERNREMPGVPSLKARYDRR